MKALLCLSMILSFSAFAQKGNECPNADTVISSQLMGEVGDEQITNHPRKGDMNIPQSLTVNGVTRTKIYQNFQDKLCVAKTFTQNEKVCEAVSVDIALGKGNAIFAGFYDLERAILVRAEAFAKKVKYHMDQPDADRLEIATQVIGLLAKDAARVGIPRKWNDFVNVLNTAVKDGTLTFHVVEDMTVTYGKENQNTLGFSPLEGANVKEAAGNGKLRALFDLSLSQTARATMIQELVKGVPQANAMALSRSFIDFANTQGIPSNWSGFVLLMKASVTSGAISDKTFVKITEDLEKANREAMGFELSAELCKMVEVRRVRNVIEEKTRKEFSREVVKSYQINITNAPLLNGEEEMFSVVFDGTRPVTLKMESAFNRYQLISQVEDNGITKLEVVGTRIKVTPINFLKATFQMVGAVPKVTLQNTAFNPKAEGKIVARIRYLDGRIFTERELGVETHFLNGSDVLNVPVAINNKNIDFIRISIQIAGSPYFNEEFSAEIKVK